MRFQRVLALNPLLLRQKNAKSLINTVSASFRLNYSSNAGKNNDHIAFDFGTSKINVAAMDENNLPKVIHTQTFLLPVKVKLDLDDVCLSINDKATLTVRHLIGRKFADPVVQKEIQRSPFNIIRGHNGQVLIKLCDDQLYDPTSFLKDYLAKAKKEAESCLGKSVSRAVITHPSVFNGVQLREIVKAGLGAGFELIHNIDETTATAIAYEMYKKEKSCWYKMFTKEKSRLFVVVDMGFRSFDVTLMEISKGGRIKFKCPTKSDLYFGGEDFDIAFAVYLVSLYNLPDEAKSFIRDNLWGSHIHIAEKCKKVLSSAIEFGSTISLSLLGQPQCICLDTTLSRSLFEGIVDPLIARIKSQIECYLKETGTESEDVDEVLLVGGMASVPKIREVVSHVFGKSPKGDVNGLNEVVALGAAAAVQAGYFGQNPWNSN